MDGLDHDYLADLIALRDGPREGATGRPSRSYYQGRIDEYCAQNALDQTDAPDLDLRLGTP